MKALLALSLTLALSSTLRAETLTIQGVHNCCKSCEKGIAKALAAIPGATLTSSTKTSATVDVKNKSDGKKVIAALMEGGYYGTIEGTASPTKAEADDKKMTSATVTGVHLCCQKCATAAADAVKSVPGVTEQTIASKADSFEVKGEFSKQDLLAALNKAGFNGKVK